MGPRQEFAEVPQSLQVGHADLTLSPAVRRAVLELHDALEFADGTIVPLARLSPGQWATVLQLPSVPLRTIEGEVATPDTKAARTRSADFFA